MQDRGKFYKQKMCLRRNQCCILYWLLILAVILYYLLRPRYIPIFSGKDYIPEPIDYSQYDEFIANQVPDPDDPLGLTLLLPFDRFSRDNVRRRIHQVWNKEKYPLYGGSVFDDLHRKVFSVTVEEEEFKKDGYAIKTEDIPNPMRKRLKEIYDN